MGIVKNLATICYSIMLCKNAQRNTAFWRIYSARAYMMVNLSYTSRMEVRQDHRTGNK